MNLRSVRAVAGRAIALLAAGFVVVVLGLSVVLPLLVGGKAYTILTGSMRPGMPPGTLVVVRPVTQDQVRIGDVLTYQIRSGDPTVATHRVAAIGISLDGVHHFTMKGDANDVADRQTVLIAQIRGKRWYSVPYLAYPSLLVDGDIRRFAVTGLAIGLLGYAGTAFVGAARERRRAGADATGAAAGAEQPDVVTSGTDKLPAEVRS